MEKQANVCLSSYLFRFLVHLNAGSWEPFRAAGLFVWKMTDTGRGRLSTEATSGKHLSKHSIAQHKQPERKPSREPGQRCAAPLGDVAQPKRRRCAHRLHTCLSDGDDDAFPLCAACRLECCARRPPHRCLSTQVELNKSVEVASVEASGSRSETSASFGGEKMQ